MRSGGVKNGCTPTWRVTFTRPDDGTAMAGCQTYAMSVQAATADDALMWAWLHDGGILRTPMYSRTRENGRELLGPLLASGHLVVELDASSELE